ncbi:agmatine deiminase family protein [Streptomyces sp. NPDC101132]|uniref:agmatine deiminase family protein n=1 Tax=Streptomyces sp. NPDC101132 TaxID=3366110 RepID=UPI003829A38B
MGNRTPNRRSVLRSGAVLAALALIEGCSAPGGDGSDGPSEGTGRGTPSAGAVPAATGQAMPAESARHTRTFMSWPALEEVWGDQLPAVRQDIAGLARTIAGFEPVVLMARPGQAAAARRACGSSVEVVELPVDDLWTRDTGPTFVTGPQGLQGVDLHFNGWGGKQVHGADSQVARRLLERYDIPRVAAPITGEGGGIEVDGAGTLMATESCWVNANRNPGKSRDQIESAFKQLFGVRKVIWLKGVAGQDITDAHVDALARFAEPGVVVLHQPHPDSPPDVWTTAADQAYVVLNEATDAQGNHLEVVDLPEPDLDLIDGAGKDFLASYLNYYVVNGGVVVPRFGDRAADARAAGIIGELHPGRKVTQVSINAIASGGGGIHCATQQQPAASGGPS